MHPTLSLIFILKQFISILDIKWNDECIDFLMIFFLWMYSIICRNKALISNFEGGFQWINEYP